MAQEKQEKQEKRETAGREPQAGAPESKAAPDTADATAGKLPEVEAPPLSPAGAAQTITPDAGTGEIKIEPADAAAVPIATPPRWTLTRRQKRQAMLAASLLLAAGLGGIAGAYAMSSWSAPKPDLAALNERKALQQSIAQLGKQVATLKTDLDKTTKAALDRTRTEQSQVAKLSDRLGDITGAIPPTQAAPVPMPRPAPRIAAAESHPTVLADWTIYDARGGYIYVRGHGDIYQVVPGAPLPGLGPVQAIRRENGAWVVVTPRGLIVANGDRRDFE